MRRLYEGVKGQARGRMGGRRRARTLEELPERARAIYDYLRYCYENGELCPTYREIGDAIGISSTSVVSYYLGKLEEVGVIDRNGGNKSRSLTLRGAKPGLAPALSLGDDEFGKLESGALLDALTEVRDELLKFIPEETSDHARWVSRSLHVEEIPALAREAHRRMLKVVSLAGMESAGENYGTAV